jgi:hypothetical protein
MTKSITLVGSNLFAEEIYCDFGLDEMIQMVKLSATHGECDLTTFQERYSSYSIRFTQSISVSVNRVDRIRTDVTFIRLFLPESINVYPLLGHDISSTAVFFQGNLIGQSGSGSLYCKFGDIDVEGTIADIDHGVCVSPTMTSPFNSTLIEVCCNC